MVVEYHAPTHRVTFFGTDNGGSEEWTTGFWLGMETPAAGPPTQAEADAIKTAWNTFFVNGTSKISSRFQCLGVKVGWVMEDGTSDPNYTKYSYYATPISGTSTDTVHLPPQIALVATLTSAKARGYGSKGRMYLPGVNAVLDATAHISGTTTTAIATNLKTFFDAINAHADVPLNAVLNAAASTGATPHDAEFWPVTGVKVGNVYDTQRRRRNQLVESYSAVALA